MTLNFAEYLRRDAALQPGPPRPPIDLQPLIDLLREARLLGRSPGSRFLPSLRPPPMPLCGALWMYGLKRDVLRPRRTQATLSGYPDYEIVVRGAGVCYRASSHNVMAKFVRHLAKLRAGLHLDRDLQAAYDRFGDGRVMLRVYETPEMRERAQAEWEERVLSSGLAR